MRYTSRCAVFVAGLAAVIVGGPSAGAQAPSPWLTLAFCTERVSLSSSGTQGSRESSSVSLSDDGRLVAFCSDAPNLVPGDTNGKYDNFIRDRVAGTTTRVTFAYEGVTGSAGDDDIFLSGDGTTIAYITRATRDGPTGRLLCAGGDPVPQRECIIVRDLQSGTAMVADTRPDGSRGNNYSRWPALSRDGRVVAFWSASTDLVAGDTNHAADVFARLDGALERQSVGQGGVAGDQGSGEGQRGADAVAVSRGGRYVVFPSKATNLVPGDSNQRSDVFVRDRVTKVTELVSRNRGGTTGSGDSVLGARQAISDDGRYVVFSSDAPDLVAGDTNGASDVFVRDRVAGQTQRASVASSGEEAVGRSGPLAAISADGRFVAFNSTAANLVPGDSNGLGDIFVRDLVAGVTVRVSVSTAGLEADGDNGNEIWRGLSVSADGQTVAWSSLADNLAPDDLNGVRDVFVRAPCASPPTPTATPTATTTRTPSATATPTRTATPTVAPSPTGPPVAGPCVCPILRSKVPLQVVADAMANPEEYGGWNRLMDDSKPGAPPYPTPGHDRPPNPRRTCLDLQNPNVPWHPAFNDVLWRAVCTSAFGPQ